MEYAGKGVKIKNAVILLCCALVIACAFYYQTNSPLALAQAGGRDAAYTYVVLTEPALVIRPSKERATIETVDLKKTPKSKEEYLSAVISRSGAAEKEVRYITPENKDWNIFWHSVRAYLTEWQYNPSYIFKYICGYFSLLKNGGTNITPAEFLLITLMAAEYDTLDFVFTLDAPKTAGNVRPGNYSPLTADDRPLIIEVLNASGKRGLALELTQYLRDLNERAVIKVDVLQYDNYPTLEERTKIIDYSGRLKELKQLSQSIGAKNTEIFHKRSSLAFMDAQIVIGKDFNMP